MDQRKRCTKSAAESSSSRAPQDCRLIRDLCDIEARLRNTDHQPNLRSYLWRLKGVQLRLWQLQQQKKLTDNQLLSDPAAVQLSIEESDLQLELDAQKGEAEGSGLRETDQNRPVLTPESQSDEDNAYVPCQDIHGGDNGGSIGCLDSGSDGLIAAHSSDSQEGRTVLGDYFPKVTNDNCTDESYQAQATVSPSSNINDVVRTRGTQELGRIARSPSLAKTKSGSVDDEIGQRGIEGVQGHSNEASNNNFLNETPRNGAQVSDWDKHCLDQSVRYGAQHESTNPSLIDHVSRQPEYVENAPNHNMELIAQTIAVVPTIAERALSYKERQTELSTTHDRAEVLVPNSVTQTCASTSSLSNRSAGTVNHRKRKRKRVSSPDAALQSPQSTRKPRSFRSDRDRQETAERRKQNACDKCHRLKERCPPNPDDPEGPCLRCMRAARRREKDDVAYDIDSSDELSVCISWKLANLTLFRDQATVWPKWTTRYNDPKLAVDIADWNGQDFKTLQICYNNPLRNPTVKEAWYTVRVRRFTPLPGDTLYEEWYDSHTCTMKRHRVEPYAIDNLNEYESALLDYTANSLSYFVIGNIADVMVTQTFVMAYKHCKDPATHPVEQRLLHKALRAWTAARCSSTTENICGPQKLSSVVDDVSSPLYGTYPLNPVIYAQFESIMLHRIQRPLQRQILMSLDWLIKSRKRAAWWTIYLVLFVLLHSCTLTSQRDSAFASQMMMQTTWANAEPIVEHQTSVTKLLAYFHREVKGFVAMKTIAEAHQCGMPIEEINLHVEQLAFVAKTAAWAAENSEKFRSAKEKGDPRHDLYYISQLYDGDWTAEKPKY